MFKFVIPKVCLACPKRLTALFPGACLCVSASAAYAEELREMRFAGGITATTHYASDQHFTSALSLDWLTSIPMATGTWNAHIEGNLLPDSASTLPGEFNADAATAVDANGDGRLQISEFYYDSPIGGGRIGIGLLDAAAYLDASDVANDETLQFLDARFVNNPVIEFPDYTIGAAYSVEPNQRHPGLALFVSSSHGIADNNEHGYDDLIRIEDEGKGVFAAAELNGAFSSVIWRLGAWTNSADHTSLDGNTTNKNNNGIYGVLDGIAGKVQWNVRLGFARPDVSEASDFAAATFAYPLTARTVLGLGLAHTGASPKLDAPVDAVMNAEAFLRLAVTHRMHLTPSVQWVRNSEFTKDTAAALGMRFNYTF